MAAGGRAAFLIPSEFMNADYGVGVKEFLVKHRSLRAIITIDFEENLFDDALTTACVLFFENDGKSKGITFTNIRSADDITLLSRALLLHTDLPGQLFVQYEDLDPTVKWRAYYQKQQSIGFKKLVPFSQVGKVVRGIATGANEYFMFNPTKATQWAISGKNLLPCVAKSADNKTSFFTDESYGQLLPFQRYKILEYPLDGFVGGFFFALPTSIQFESHQAAEVHGSPEIV